jgi:hypothetical protein
MASKKNASRVELQSTCLALAAEVTRYAAKLRRSERRTEYLEGKVAEYLALNEKLAASPENVAKEFALEKYRRLP